MNDDKLLKFPFDWTQKEVLAEMCDEMCDNDICEGVLCEECAFRSVEKFEKYLNQDKYID